MEEVVVMFCVFLVIVQTREDMVLIRRVPDTSLLDLLRRKLISGNMDYEEENDPSSKTPANFERIKTNSSFPASRLLHHNPYQNTPDLLFNPYHETRYNPSYYPHYKPLQNPGYAPFHQAPYVVYQTTENPQESSQNPVFLAPQLPFYIRSEQRILRQSQQTLLPPSKKPFMWNHRIPNNEPQQSTPYPSEELVTNMVPPKKPFKWNHRIPNNEPQQSTPYPSEELVTNMVPPKKPFKWNHRIPNNEPQQSTPYPSGELVTNMVPPKKPFKWNHRIPNNEPQQSFPYPPEEATNLPANPPFRQVLPSRPQNINFRNADKPIQYRAYRYIPTKKSTSTVTYKTPQTNSHKKMNGRPNYLVPGKLVPNESDYLINEQATSPTSMEVWKNEDDMTTEQTFGGYKLASGITSMILSSFEEDYKILKTLEKTGLVERYPEKNVNSGKKEIAIIRSNPKIIENSEKTLELRPNIVDRIYQQNPKNLQKKRVMPTLKTGKREKEMDLEALLKKAIKRAEERTMLEPLSFQSYENGSYPLRRTFDRVRWKYPRELI